MNWSMKSPMKFFLVLASVVTALCTVSTAPVIAGGDVSDVVRARANARAGGGTSGHDAYILKQTGGALSGTKAKARAKKKAAKKYRARKAAQKKAAARKRRAAIAAKKKKAARQHAIAARKAKEKRAAARRATAKRNAESDADTTDKDVTTTAAPSTSAVLTNQDVSGEQPDAANDNGADVLAANDNDKVNTDAKTEAKKTVETPAADTSSPSEPGAAGECKRFIPEVGKTVTVDC